MISYVDSIEGVSADKLAGFFEGWPNPPSPETHLKLLAKSDNFILAVDDGTGNVVGFITAITDRVLNAYIPLLEVVPSYRGRGIGSELTRRLLAELSGLYMVHLLCDPELEQFYARFGMKPARGMKIQNFDRQSGE